MAVLPIVEGKNAEPIALVAVDVSVGGFDSMPNDATVLLMVSTPIAQSLILKNPHPGFPDAPIPLEAGISFTTFFDPFAWNNVVTGSVDFTFDTPAGVSVMAYRPGYLSFDPAAPLGSLP